MNVHQRARCGTQAGPLMNVHGAPKRRRPKPSSLRPVHHRLTAQQDRFADRAPPTVQLTCAINAPWRTSLFSSTRRVIIPESSGYTSACLLYTSDAADDLTRVDLG